VTIETERLILRPYVDSDAERVLDIHSRLEVIRWLSDPPFVPMTDLDEARARIVHWATVSDGGPYDVALAIEIRETGVVAGSVMVLPLPNAEHGERHVGWHLHPDSVGHGYATEAAAALLDDVFGRGIEEIWCDMFPDNDASAAVATRLGLIDLGIVPDSWYGDESRIFRTTREKWLTQEARATT
jgi:RimJ/RimL family protein N-acetyltransferase